MWAKLGPARFGLQPEWARPEWAGLAHFSAIILRDNIGSFVVPRSNYFNGLGSVREVEITGLVEAIHWVLFMGFSQVLFELDAKGVVDVIASTV